MEDYLRDQQIANLFNSQRAEMGPERRWCKRKGNAAIVASWAGIAGKRFFVNNCQKRAPIIFTYITKSTLAAR
jgi:hypothetical protein